MIRGKVRQPRKRSARTRSLRRDRTVVTTLLLLTTGAALLLAPHEAASTLIAVLIPLTGVYVAWLTYRDSRDGKDTLKLGDVADQLARSLATQWFDEAKKRGLNNPYPLAIRWTAVKTPLAEGWDSLVAIATRGIGWPGSPPDRIWATGPKKLAGTGRELAEILPRVPTGRVLILGHAGSGKTTLMVQVLLDLLQHRVSGGPVPVLVSLASWNPIEQELDTWLAVQLIHGNPALADAAPTGFEADTRIDALIAENLILPMLDGLDEIPEAVRELAIKKINDVRPGMRMFVTYRTEGHGNTISTRGRRVGQETALHAVAVKLRPLDSAEDVAEVADYLSGGSDSKAAQWEPVLKELGTSRPLGQALTTPLMVDLVRAIYNPGPDERIGLTPNEVELPDPSELCGPKFTDRKSVEGQLFKDFVSAVYRRRRDGRWSPEKAQKWLAYLARNQGFDIVWWQFWKMVPPQVFAIAAGILIGLAAGVSTALGHGLDHGVTSGLIVGFSAAPPAAVAGGLSTWIAVTRWRHIESAFKPAWRIQVRDIILAGSVGFSLMVSLGLAYGLASTVSEGPQAGLQAGLYPGLGGLAVGTAVGLAATTWRQPRPSSGLRGRFGVNSILPAFLGGTCGGLGLGLPYGLTYGVVAGIAEGLAVGMAFGLEKRPPLTAAASPATTLSRDRQAVLFIGLAPALGIGLVFGLGYPPLFGIPIGLMVGVGFGLMITTLKTAWPLYMATRIYLALQGELPWALMAFLADAREHGILRQDGPLYQFRHKDLQIQLATQTFEYNPLASDAIESKS